MQALDLVEHLGVFGATGFGEAAGVALERCIPVDAASRRIDLGDSQQIGMLARQARGNGGAQLAGRTPHGITCQSQRAVALERFTDEKRTCGHLSVPQRGHCMA